MEKSSRFVERSREKCSSFDKCPHLEEPIQFYNPEQYCCQKDGFIYIASQITKKRSNAQAEYLHTNRESFSYEIRAAHEKI